jgi:hypothetical protein
MFGDFPERQRAAVTKKAATICRRFFCKLFAGEFESIAEMKGVSRSGFSVIGRYDVLKDKIRFEPPTDTVI